MVGGAARLWLDGWGHRVRHAGGAHPRRHHGGGLANPLRTRAARLAVAGGRGLATTARLAARPRGAGAGTQRRPSRRRRAFPRSAAPGARPSYPLPVRGGSGSPRWHRPAARRGGRRRRRGGLRPAAAHGGRAQRTALPGTGSPDRCGGTAPRSAHRYLRAPAGRSGGPARGVFPGAGGTAARTVAGHRPHGANAGGAFARRHAGPLPRVVVGRGGKRCGIARRPRRRLGERAAGLATGRGPSVRPHGGAAAGRYPSGHRRGHRGDGCRAAQRPCRSRRLRDVERRCPDHRQLRRAHHGGDPLPALHLRHRRAFHRVVRRRRCKCPAELAGRALARPAPLRASARGHGTTAARRRVGGGAGGP